MTAEKNNPEDNPTETKPRGPFLNEDNQPISQDTTTSTTPAASESEDSHSHNKITLIIAGIFIVVFIFLFVRFLLQGGQKHQQAEVNKARTEQVNKMIQKNPQMASSLTGNQKNSTKDNSNNNEHTQALDTLNRYANIDKANSLTLLKLHDAIATLQQNRNLDQFRQTLNTLKNQTTQNSNLLGSITKKGYLPLYQVSNQRTTTINKLLDQENQSNELQQIQSLYNQVAQKTPQYNKEFLTAFKRALETHHISYQIDNNGNFQY